MRAYVSPVSAQPQPLHGGPAREDRAYPPEEPPPESSPAVEHGPAVLRRLAERGVARDVEVGAYQARQASSFTTYTCPTVSPRPKHLDPDPCDVFPPTAEGVLRWVETTRETGGRRPRREVVVEHVGWLRREGLLGAEDLRLLRAHGYA